MFRLKQLIRNPTRVTSNNSSIVDNILIKFHERVSQQGIIDVGLSDHIAKGRYQQ